MPSTCRWRRCARSCESRALARVESPSRRAAIASPRVTRARWKSLSAASPAWRRARSAPPRSASDALPVWVPAPNACSRRPSRMAWRAVRKACQNAGLGVPGAGPDSALAVASAALSVAHSAVAMPRKARTSVSSAMRPSTRHTTRAASSGVSQNGPWLRLSALRKRGSRSRCSPQPACTPQFCQSRNARLIIMRCVLASDTAPRRSASRTKGCSGDRRCA